jgi:hypothetical protein
VREAYPDHTQFDKASEYHDPKATQEKPRWFMVDVQLERRLARCAECGPGARAAGARRARLASAPGPCPGRRALQRRGVPLPPPLPNRPRQISLEELKGHKEGALKDMALFRQSRLSVQPVAAAEWEFILGLEAAPAAGAGGSSSGGGGGGGAAAGAAGRKKK